MRCMKPTYEPTAATPSVDGIAVSKAGMSATTDRRTWDENWRALSTTDNPQGRNNVDVLAVVTCRHDQKIKSRGKGDRMTDRPSNEVP